MARLIRLWEKKRGGRRTGSNLLGSIGEALFYVALFLLGISSLVAVLASPLTHSWPASHFFPERYYKEATGIAEDKRLGKQEQENESRFRPEILIVYEVSGRPFRQWTYDISGEYRRDLDSQQAILDRFEIGREYRCWYDPDDPDRVILHRRSSWGFWLTILVLTSFVLIGGRGVVATVLQVGTSAERRSAIARRAADIDLIGESALPSKDFPNIPCDANMTNSPGTKLAYRLPIAQSPGWRLLVAGLFCLLWNTMLTIFVVLAIRSHLLGQPDWLLTICVVPFLAIGVWSVYYFLKELLITTWIGPMNIEISEYPLYPGGKYQIYMTQSGQLVVRAMRIKLVCDEESTFRQGTDVRNDVQRVYEEEIFAQNQFEISSSVPFEHQFELIIPDHSMHSFQSDHNVVQWKLEVEGDVIGWPKYTRIFPLVIYPTPFLQETPHGSVDQSPVS